MIVHKVAARAVRTVAGGVEGATQLGFVLGMARHVAQFGKAVRELTLVAVLARAVLLVGATQLGLVARGGRLLLGAVGHGGVHLLLVLKLELLLLLLELALGRGARRGRDRRR